MTNERALAIRCIFSLVDMIIKTKFSNRLMFLKLVYFGSQICIVSIKLCSKEIHHLQSRENLCLLHPPVVLRLYTGCRLGETFSKSIVGFQKVNVLKYYGISVLHFLNFAAFLLRMRTKYT